MDSHGQSDVLPEPIVISCTESRLNDLLTREWLIANKIGAYASSTVIGCNTRRYHGLLVAATAPPMGRMVTLATVMERLVTPNDTYELATNEFPGAFYPSGISYLVEYRNDLAATFVYRLDGLELIKRIILAETSNTVAVEYTLNGGSAELQVNPFVAMRDFHSLRERTSDQLTFDIGQQGLVIRDEAQAPNPLYLSVDRGSFEPAPQWWHSFLYRADFARGEEGFDELYTPGAFRCRLEPGRALQLTASLGKPEKLDVSATLQRRRAHLEQIVSNLPDSADQITRALAVASDTFIARRNLARTPFSSTILAGFHWFADWGRDAFISLPGLLLTTGRFAQARQTFATFASYISEGGLIPNCFDDRGGPPAYNSIDASLWFIVAADRYMDATNDNEFWRETLMPACHKILTAYERGTDFCIHADGEGLLAGGSEKTQLTWMDAALEQEVITPRHGKAVEVNALWYCAHRVMERWCESLDAGMARQYAERAEQIASAFAKTFWNEDEQCLYDCITDGVPDASIRPNQILAVSLPHSPLPIDRQQAVVRIVRDKLLTPIGLRTLAADDKRFYPRYEGDRRQRDRAYHQGTVWPWLMGPFIEAYLRVNGYKPDALRQAAEWLKPFDEHLSQAGVGFISEIFDATSPYRPRGCIAQAWSVAEILRAKVLICERSGGVSQQQRPQGA